MKQLELLDRRLLFPDGYHVQDVPRRLYEDYIMNIHYAHRMPPVSYAYGLYLNGDLCGIVTYGTPLSSTLRDGVAGKKYTLNVKELNRLVLMYNRKNEASMLVSRSLKMLGAIGDMIIVSYADPSYGHVGYVYQACNFMYTGLSSKASDWHVDGMEELHHVTIEDVARGAKNRVEVLRKVYGDRLKKKERVRKHRYVYIVGSRAFKTEAMSNLRYEILPYPKEIT